MLRTEISCWISCISSSLDSRSIYEGGSVSIRLMRDPGWRLRTYMFDGNCLSRCFIDCLVDNTEAATCDALAYCVDGVAVENHLRPSSSNTW